MARMGQDRTAFRVAMNRPGRKKPVGRPRRRWVANVSAWFGGGG